jgi:hypothetical protein
MGGDFNTVIDGDLTVKYAAYESLENKPGFFLQGELEN